LTFLSFLQTSYDASEMVGIVCDNGFAPDAVLVYDAARAPDVDSYVRDACGGVAMYPLLFSVC